MILTGAMIVYRLCDVGMLRIKTKKKSAAEVGVSAVMSLAANSHDITENKHRGCPVVWTNMRL